VERRGTAAMGTLSVVISGSKKNREKREEKKKKMIWGGEEGGLGSDGSNSKYAATLDSHVGRSNVFWTTTIHLNKFMDLNVDFTRS
jgi:hypothetical protein